MLFTPEAHEALADEPWSAERARTAIASIVADASDQPRAYSSAERDSNSNPTKRSSPITPAS
jgi:hypothetical protein